MIKRKLVGLAVPCVLTIFLTTTASAQTPYGSFTELEYHEFIAESISSIDGIAGFCYGGGFLWAISSAGKLIKINPSGSIVSTKDILAVGGRGAICYDSGTLWVVSTLNQILPFDTNGNSLGSGIDISRLPSPFNGEIFGAIKDVDGFWLYAYWVPMIFKVDMSGNVVKQFPNSWLDQGRSTIAKQGNKIYKFTYNTPSSNDFSKDCEALAIDVDSGSVTDSWKYPKNSDPIGLSSGDSCFWTLEFNVSTHKIIIRKLSIPNPSPPPGLPSTQWGDFTIKKWGYPPVGPSMIEGLYGFDYDRNTNKIWLGNAIALLYGAIDAGTAIFPLVGEWVLGLRIPYDIATYGTSMWIAQYWLGYSRPTVSQIEIVGGSFNVLKEWSIGMSRATGLATNGTYFWVSGREGGQSTADPNNNIRKFDLAGNFIGQFQYPETTNYEDLAWHKGGLWAINMPSSISCNIHRINPDTGAVLAVYQTGWGNIPDDNIKGTLASNGDSLLTFAALSTGFWEYYQRSHLRLIEIQDLDTAQPSFTISSSPTSATVTAGQSATYTIQVTPKYGPFNSSVSFDCTGLPSKCTASFSPTNVTPGANVVTTALILTTEAASGSAVGALAGSASVVPPASDLLVLALILMLGIRLGKRAPSRLSRRPLAAAGLICLVIVLASCGKGNNQTNNGTPPGTYQVTVRGVSGSLTASTTITLVVR